MEYALGMATGHGNPPGPTYVGGIGERVRAAREAASLNQAQLAAKVGVQQPVISKLERGQRRRADTKLLQAIADAVGVPLSELLDNPSDAAALQPDTERASPPPSKLPPGLDGFLGRHARRLKITRRERVYLEADRTQTEAWLVKDDGYWERRLRFWREELALQDKATGVGGEEDPT